jgi:hypothetical protein
MACHRIRENFKLLKDWDGDRATAIEFHNRVVHGIFTRTEEQVAQSTGMVGACLWMASTRACLCCSIYSFSLFRSKAVLELESGRASCWDRGWAISRIAASCSSASVTSRVSRITGCPW